MKQVKSLGKEAIALKLRPKFNEGLFDDITGPEGIKNCSDNNGINFGMQPGFFFSTTTYRILKARGYNQNYISLF